MQRVYEELNFFRLINANREYVSLVKYPGYRDDIDRLCDLAREYEHFSDIATDEEYYAKEGVFKEKIKALEAEIDIKVTRYKGWSTKKIENQSKIKLILKRGLKLLRNKK